MNQGADAQTAERVWSMIVGFSGFGFPKAHGAAFGLLAYQSTWLRVHYGPEFLCSLLDEQPMGFYPPDALVHDAQRRGIEVLAPDVNHSAVGCTVTAEGAVRIGLGYVLGVRADEVAALVAERKPRGPFASLGDLASRAGAGRPALETLAWSGACDALAGGDRAGRLARRALWQLGVAAPGERPRDERGGDPALAAARTAGRSRARAAQRRESMIADYATTGLTTGPHALALLRDRLRGEGMVTSGDLGAMRHNARVTVAGRRRAPAPRDREGHRLHAARGRGGHGQPGRAAGGLRASSHRGPLGAADRRGGKLERHPAGGGQINVLVATMRGLDGAQRPAAEVKDFSMLDEAELARQRDGDFRAVAPPVQSFASGRRR